MKKFLLFTLAVVFCAGSAAHLIEGTGREETGFNTRFAPHNTQYHNPKIFKWEFDSLVALGHYHDIIDEIDLRIDKLNALAKPLYAINCSNAFTRSEHCVALAKALSELVAVDNAHHNHFCVFDLLPAWGEAAHENLAFYNRPEKIVSEICTRIQTNSPGEYHNAKTDLISWITSGRLDQFYKERTLANRPYSVRSHVQAYAQAFIDYRAEFRPATPTTPTF